MGKQKKTTAKAYEVRLSANALRNIDEIAGYIAFIGHSPFNALRVGDAIFDVIDRIQLHPLAFRECDELPTKTKMYRRARCLSWLIVYKVVGFEIVILGVIHGARRPTNIKSLRRIK